MQSIISLMSVNNSDIAPLDDLEDIPDLENSGDLDFIMDFSQQMEQMTTSLTGSDLAATPMSSKCLFLSFSFLFKKNVLIFFFIKLKFHL